MVSKEKIDRPKLCFKVIRPRIITWRIIFRCPFVHLFFDYSFLFDSLFFFWFLFQCFCFVLAHFIFQWRELDIFWNSNFSYLPSNIRHLIIYNPLKNIFFRLCPQCGGDPWSGYWKKLSSSKGRLSDNFLHQWKNGERWPFFISNTII